ncbi:MAG TPA: MFS transporter [Phycisphaerae bacterium]|nr:MFS transporter [Phycisphaerae bacterium]
MTAELSVAIPLTSTAAQRARGATLAIFFIQGAVFATWVSRIAVVQERLGLSNSRLGLALLAISLAGMVAMPVTGRVVARVGSRAAVRVAVMLYCLMLLLPGVAGNYAELWAGLFGLGAMFGVMNVAINSQAVVVERAYGRPIMAGFHALFSLGGMAGAAVGGLMAARGVPVLMHFAMAAGVLGTVGAVAAPMMLAEPAREGTHEEHGSGWRAFLHPRLLMLGVVAFCVLVGEGAMADWTAVYLHRGLGTGLGFAAAGYAAFSLAMTGGRLVADRVTAAIGPVHFVRYGAALAAVGLAVGLASHVPMVALLGFACAGAGFSGICPILFSAGGRTKGVAPSEGIAAVATMGFVGFLIGPPVIGVVADWTSLTWGLGVVVLASGVAAGLAGRVGEGGNSE